MPLELMKNETLKEMEAVKCFIEMAIESQKYGYTKAAKFFLKEAKEDCEHAFLYARELDKHCEKIEGKRTILDIAKDYHQLEAGAITRISELRDEAHKQHFIDAYPFITSMMRRHSEDTYNAKKLAQKIEVLLRADSLSDIEELFDEEEDNNNNNFLEN